MSIAPSRTHHARSHSVTITRTVTVSWTRSHHTWSHPITGAHHTRTHTISRTGPHPITGTGTVSLLFLARRLSEDWSRQHRQKQNRQYTGFYLTHFASSI